MTEPAPALSSRIAAGELPSERRGSVLEVLLVALRLGVTSFGGPIAHIGYFRNEYVTRRHWVDEQTYADLVALSQSLPGSSSSKIGIAIGILRAGLAGGMAAWIGFTLPAALLLVAFAIGLQSLGPDAQAWLHGLKVVAVAVVALAVWSMARNLAPDRPRASLALAAAVVALALPSAVTQLAIILASGALGWALLRGAALEPRPHVHVPIGRWTALAAGAAFFVLLVALPVMRQASGDHAVAIVDSFYRSGSLVFGGGHVVLPLLHDEVVIPGWIGNDQFLAGYGAAQAVPGPLFTFAAFLGAAMTPAPNGLLGATLALLAIFLPSILLTVAVLPSWGAVRTHRGVQAALTGIGAGVVGVLLAALYDPVGKNGITGPLDVVLALAAFAALSVGKLPPWLVVLGTALAGATLHAIGAA